MVDETGILVTEPVVILPPNVARQQIIQRGDWPSPRNVTGDLQPFGVLVEHRVNDMNERLITRKEPVAAGQKIALKPALALVLAKHLHDPTIRREMVIPRKGFRDPGAIGYLEDILPAVRVVLVWTEKPEVPRVHIHLHDVPQELAHHSSGFGEHSAGRGNLDRVI